MPNIPGFILKKDVCLDERAAFLDEKAICLNKKAAFSDDYVINYTGTSQAPPVQVESNRFL